MQDLKRKNIEDKEVARGLIKKAIKLDDNLLIAKSLLGGIYFVTGDYDKALEIAKQNINQAEKLNDKKIKADSLNVIGAIYLYKVYNYEKALEHYTRELAIFKDIGDMNGIGRCYNYIGIVYCMSNRNDEGIDYQTRALNIYKELDDNFLLGFSLGWFGNTFTDIGMYDKALNFYEQAQDIYDNKILSNWGSGVNLGNIGSLLSKKGRYNEALTRTT